MTKKSTPTTASQDETDRITRIDSVAVTVVDDDMSSLKQELDILRTEFTALRDAYTETKNHVRRIGECPGLKLF